VRHNAHNRRTRGASTISQQVAKNLFLWSGRSYLRKGLEAGFTVLIEWLWPKERILEVYLNIAQFGRGTYGVEAAAQRYFHKPARRLRRAEGALLAAVLPNPVRLRVEAPSAYVRSRQEWIMGQMADLGGTAYLEELERAER
jgi:monofunctional biosynthetic peptidoglycan transglycosylase